MAMTKAQSLENSKIAPGRELDLLLAEKIFGWRWKIFDNGHIRQNWLVAPDDRKNPYLKLGFEAGLASQGHPPEFSGKLEAAWLLADRFKAQGFSLAYDVARAKWVCTIGTLTPVSGANASPILAICLAALEASK